MEKYFVLVMNASRQASLVGTATGNAFRSERSAQQAMRRMERMAPTLHMIVLSVDTMDNFQNVFAR